MTRRLFLASPALAAPRPDAEAAVPKAAKSSRLFLFWDWHHVQKGDLAVVVDDTRVSEAGRKLRKELVRDFNRTFESGAHGFRRSNLPFGVRVTPEVAQKSPRWMKADRPWEADVSFTSVIRHEDRYRCWYNARLRQQQLRMVVQGGQAMEVKGTALAYAESRDGYTWSKPALPVVKGTNLVTPHANAACVFLDPAGREDERFKLLHFDLLAQSDIQQSKGTHGKYGLFGVTSPDGLRWTKHNKPLIKYFSDTQNIVAWDPLLNKYVGYYRHHFSGRTISRAVTADFWSWPEPEPWLFAGPLDAPDEDYYCNGYTTHPDDPSLRLLFVSVYHHGSDNVDVRLAVSRDGGVWQWVSYQPVIRHGKVGEWDSGSAYACPNLVRLPDGKLALPYLGKRSTHNEAWFKNLYENYPDDSGLAWAFWEDGRLAGIEAPEFGEFVTRPLGLDGTQLEVNVRTNRSGFLRTELREGDKAIAGFSFAESVPIIGDHHWERCRWKDKPDLSSLRGKSVSVALGMSSAKVFGLRIAGA